MFYLINKPKGVSSFLAIKQFAQKHGIKKIGHSGTLDPLATGALLVATNADTKLLSYVLQMDKTYDVTFKTGFISNTYDAQGTITYVSSQLVLLAQIKQILYQFLGKSYQQPPIFSAKKINGIRSYQLARKGQVVDLPKSLIEVKKITKIKQINEATFSFQIVVSVGTYIRSIVHDLGQKIGCGAYMIALHRTKIGSFRIKSDVQELNPLRFIKLKKIVLSDVTDFWHGRSFLVQRKNGLYMLIYKSQIIGTGEVINQVLNPKKVLIKKIKKIL